MGCLAGEEILEHGSNLGGLLEVHERSHALEYVSGTVGDHLQQLLLAVDAAAEETLKQLPMPVWSIGRMTSHGFHLRDADGQLLEIEPRGYEH